MIVIKSYKIRLYPTKEQEKNFIQSCGVMRYVYNWALEMQNKNYKNENNKYISSYDLQKQFTQFKKLEENKWLNDFSSNMSKMAIMDCNSAFKRFFNKQNEYPKFKSKRKSKLSFYVRHDKINPKETSVNFEKIGRIKIKKNSIPIGVKLSNPRCSFDGKYWYLSFGIEENIQQLQNNKTKGIGIDLGIKDTAICSNGVTYKNINKTKRIKQIEKRLKRLQRQVNRKYIMNKQGNKYIKTNNIIKLEKCIKLLYRKLSNIRKTYNHTMTKEIIKRNPSFITIEDLNIKGMMKNRHLSNAVQQQNLYEIIRQLTYKCNWYGIELRQVNRFYPSSKLCHECGYINKDLKLSDRTYICPSCGSVIDRDFQASLNLRDAKEYKILA